MSWKLRINGTFFIALIFLIVSLFLIITVTNSSQNYSKVFMPREGELELSESDFRYSILLSGEWEYYDRQLLDGLDGSEASPEYVMVPHVWNGTGYGSYRLVVEGILPDKCYNLSVPDMGGAYRLFINGNEMGHNGEVAAEASSERLHWEPGVIAFSSTKSTLEIVVQISNFHSIPGGFLREMKLGLPQIIQRDMNRKLSGEMVVLGGLLIIALYNLCLFILNTSNRSSLFFTLFNLTVSLRILLTGERIINLLFLDLNWLPLIRLLYISGSLMLFFFILFMDSLFRTDFHRWILKLFYGLIIVFLGPGAFLPLSYIRIADIFYIILTILYFVYLLYILLRVVKAHRPGAVYAFIGIAFLLGTILLDMTLPPSTNILPLGIFIFTVFQSLVVAERHSQVVEQNRALHHVAVRDDMTGLFKKQHFRTLVEESLEQNIEEQGGDNGHVMMFIDMDNFKSVNDSYGHDTGDELIITVARALHGALRLSDQACRYGGDEFVIWLQGAEREVAESVAGRILQQISKPVSINGFEFSQSVSIGMSFYPDDAADFYGLMEVSDRRMYQAKRAGKNRFCSGD